MAKQRGGTPSTCYFLRSTIVTTAFLTFSARALQPQAETSVISFQQHSIIFFLVWRLFGTSGEIGNIAPSRWAKNKMQALYHPLLFGLMVSCGLTELGLTVFLLTVGNENGTWPSSQYHKYIINFPLLCRSLDSPIFYDIHVDGASHLLANVASSIIWLLVTTILWGVGAGLMHITREGGDCEGRPTLSECRQSLTVEALGWTELAVCGCTLLLTLIWICLSTLAGPIVKDDRESESSQQTV